MLPTLNFSPLQSIVNEEQHEKRLYNQSSHYRKKRFACQNTHLTNWVITLPFPAILIILIV